MRVKDTVRVARLSRKEFIADKALKAGRRLGAPGVITGILGRREERYLVVHEGEQTPAVYIQEELEPEPAAYWKVTYSKWGRAYFEELATYQDVEELQFELEASGVKSIAVEGPFYSDKELTEGLLPARTLFDHLKSTE